MLNNIKREEDISYFGKVYFENWNMMIEEFIELEYLENYNKKESDNKKIDFLNKIKQEGNEVYNIPIIFNVYGAISVPCDKFNSYREASSYVDDNMNNIMLDCYETNDSEIINYIGFDLIDNIKTTNLIIKEYEIEQERLDNDILNHDFDNFLKTEIGIVMNTYYKPSDVPNNFNYDEIYDIIQDDEIFEKEIDNMVISRINDYIANLKKK